MTPRSRRLLAILDQETAVARELTEVLQGDQRRIVARDIEGLEQSTLLKEALVLRLNSLDETRRRITDEIGSTLGLPPDQVRESAISSLLGREGADLDAGVEKLRAVIGSLRELVAVSRGFVEQSLPGVRALLT